MLDFMFYILLIAIIGALGIGLYKRSPIFLLSGGMLAILFSLLLFTSGFEYVSGRHYDINSSDENKMDWNNTYTSLIPGLTPVADIGITIITYMTLIAGIIFTVAAYVLYRRT